MTSVRRAQGRLAALFVLAVGVAIAAGAWLWPGTSSMQRPERTAGGACSWRGVLGGHSARWPDCRRAYGADSPFNEPLGASPRLTVVSPATITQLLGVGGGGPPAPFVVGDPLRDGGVPVYRSRPHDPLYTLNCTRPWGRCEIEGAKVRIPSVARPAGVWPDPHEVTDGHLTVIDPSTRTEYDLWDVSHKSRHGGRLDFGWGGKTPIDGNGLGSGAVAASWGSLAGLIRTHELISGQIQHALAIAVPCASGVVFPATSGGLSCKAAGFPGADAPPIGARLQLNMSDPEIRALGLPKWQSGILRAFARYGAFVSDTTGSDHWGFEYESAADYESFGKPDPRIAFAGRLGATPQDFNHNGQLEYSLPFSPSIDWGRLRVVAPCVSRGRC